MHEHIYTYTTYLHICEHIYTHANMFRHINRHGWRWGCANIFTRIQHIYTYANICKHKNRYGWRRGCTNTFTHIQHMPKYANIFTYMRTYLHVKIGTDGDGDARGDGHDTGDSEGAESFEPPLVRRRTSSSFRTSRSRRSKRPRERVCV